MNLFQVSCGTLASMDRYRIDEMSVPKVEYHALLFPPLIFFP